MPQFIMEGSTAPDFTALDEFTRGYIEAIFFTDAEPGNAIFSTRPRWLSGHHPRLTGAHQERLRRLPSANLRAISGVARR